MLRKIIYLFTILIFSASLSFGADHRFTLVIDAGHGGHDAGALGAFSKEKNINLNVALAFGRFVERNCPDVRVVYTRKTDVFIPLDDRADIANRNKADLFVSIHTNALPDGRIARGLETYTLGMARAQANLDVAKRENSVILVEKDYKLHYKGFDPNSSESYIMFEFMQDKYMEKSVELAKMVQRNVCSCANRPDKGVHQAGFLVLRKTSMPSCLIELGFITTPDEEQMLNSESGIENLAKGIYNAFVSYKKKFDSAISVPYKTYQPDEINIPTIVPDNEISQPIQAKREPMPVNKPEVEKQDSDSKTAMSDVNNVTVTQSVTSKSANEENEDSDTLSFRIQVLASSRMLRPGSQQFNSMTGLDYYQEDGMFKYTYGSSSNYNEIYRLRKTIIDKFPGAFIVAFKGTKKVNINEAIQEYKSNRK